MSSKKENVKHEFVSHFFQQNSNSELYNNYNVAKFENDIFCLRGLMKSLLLSNEENNKVILDHSLAVRPLDKDFVQFTAEETVSNVVGDVVKYANRSANESESALCDNNATDIPNAVRCMQMNTYENVRFVSKYFVQSTDESTILSDTKDILKICEQDRPKNNEDSYLQVKTEEDFSSDHNLDDGENDQNVGMELSNEEFYSNREDGTQNLEDSATLDEMCQNSQEDEEFLIQSDPRIEPFNIEPFFNISPRIMPVSPHRIIEEEFKSNPWVMLVVTIFLTKTTGKAARPLMKEFFSLYPTPYEVLKTDPVYLERFFVNLGMRKRAHMIWRMSFEFVSSKWRRASDLHGIGKYGEDAYRIFCLGHTDVEPTDRYLRLYLDWLKSHTDHDEFFSQVDSECVIMDPIMKYYSISLR